ncbi:MAG: polysaccharide biosynthesis/export family protein [Bacteroidales bacterium]|nr:polysaccharide biosynthesis/export family protein [Bacteroidales bacterium]
MKKTINFLLRLFLGFFVSAVVFSSCIPIKRIEYLQQEVAKNDTIRTHFKSDLIDYRLQPGDNLYIKVNSVLATSENIFAEDNSRSSNNYYSDAGIYLNSYLISQDGYIDFPFVGKVYVKDLTVEEAKDLISNIVKDYIKESTVVVRLALFNITALGEFSRTGQINIFQNRINIFEAIAQAGDMTSFARRDQVILIRRTSDGAKTKKLNLNDVNILESEYYYIQPNDILYAPPVKGKNFAFAQFPYALVFSTISTTLLLINFFNTN